MEAKPLVPKLRFPEFRSSPGWEQRQLGDLLQITSSKRVHESEWTDHGVPFYRARELVALNNGEPITPLCISEELYRHNAQATGEISDGDLLVTGVGSIGVPYLVKKNDRFYFKDGNIVWLKNTRQKVNGSYLHQLFLSSPIQTQITKMAGVGTVGTFTIESAKRTRIPLPPDPAEQQKIADCLTSLDELIAAERRKLEALRTHKKSLMQNLFPREGETVPRLRFPEFRNVGAWTYVRLGAVTAESTVRNSSALTSDSVMGVTKAEGIFPMEKRLIGANVSRYKLLCDNWFAYNPMRLNIGSIARYRGDSEVVVSPDYVVFRCLEGSALLLTSDFLDHYRYTDHWRRFVGKGHNLGVRVRIYYADLAELLIPLPTPEEQHRIADCLAYLDAIINAQAKKLDTLKLHKQGLMQGLFPSSEET